MYTATPEKPPRTPKNKLDRPTKAAVKDAPVKVNTAVVDVEGGGTRVVDARPTARRRVPNQWALGVDHHVRQCVRPPRAIGSPLTDPSGPQRGRGWLSRGNLYHTGRHA